MLPEDPVITAILAREGGATFTNHPADRGGPTKWGITQRAWSEEIGGPETPTPADVGAITESQARAFYLKRYVRLPKFDQVLDQTLAELLIDCGVNHGPATAAAWVQAAVGVDADGKLGPVSLAAINRAPPQMVFLKVCAQRVRLYGRLTSKDPQLKVAKAAGIRLQAENTAGWCNRAADFIDAAAARIKGKGDA